MDSLVFIFEVGRMAPKSNLYSPGKGRKEVIMNNNKIIFSFDAETNGLWGKAFAVAVIVYTPEGEEVERLSLRCPIEGGEVSPWVAENVLPQMEAIEVTHGSYSEMLKAFSEFWLKYKDVAVALVHMGHIVEAALIRDAHEMGYLGDWDAPYLWNDLCVIPEVGDSVDAYAKAHGIEVSDYAGGTHNPLYDSEVTAKVYFHVMG